MAKKKPINQNEFAFDSDEEAIKALQSEGRRLKYIAIKVWRQYLNSYTPKQYVRTRDSQRSIKLGKVYKVDENTWGIAVTFDNDLAYHDSILYTDEPQGHAIMLISQGWTVKDSAMHRDVYRFGYYEGFDYIEKVMKEFNNTAKQGTTLRVEWKGRNYDPDKPVKDVLR